MFIFYFLGVGLPWRSIFCQFWLCEEAQCVYLRRHLGSPALLFQLTEFNGTQNASQFNKYLCKCLLWDKMNMMSLTLALEEVNILVGK